MVGVVEVYGGSGGGVWWEGWMSAVGGVDECGGRGVGGVKECGGRGGGVWWEGWMSVVGGVKECGGRGGGVWEG